ncbi:hypothetical protein C2G38_2209891 [Gigaspora rosea]|uniref:HCP-like protein n=1 Tax=Gigaspora rosea TaxID=44941 RepID=A0A397UFV8_9GLOM|nr:hypothetical protein C2G38_2209891 [Gigaspora rosea]
MVGVEKDERKTFIYHQKAADTGHVKGIYNLAICYSKGIGVKQDEYFQKFADMGSRRNVQGWLQLLKWNCKSAEMGMCNVGFCYYHGIGVKADKHKEFYYYEKSSEIRCAQGKFNAAACYRFGIEIEKDKNKAFAHYQESAKLGHVKGILHTGDSDGLLQVVCCYFYGLVVEKDEHKAFMYFQRFADAEDIEGISHLALCYRNGIGIKRDLNKSEYWYRMHFTLACVPPEEFNGIISALECQKQSLRDVIIEAFGYSEEFKMLMNCENLEISRIRFAIMRIYWKNYEIDS